MSGPDIRWEDGDDSPYCYGHGGHIDDDRCDWCGECMCERCDYDIAQPLGIRIFMCGECVNKYDYKDGDPVPPCRLSPEDIYRIQNPGCPIKIDPPKPVSVTPDPQWEQPTRSIHVD